MPVEHCKHFDSEMLEDCSLDVAQCLEFDERANTIGKLYCVYRIEGDYKRVSNEELVEKNYVPDAATTLESWIIEEVVPTSHSFIFVTKSEMAGDICSIEYTDLGTDISSIVRYDDYITWGTLNSHYTEDGNLKKIPRVQPNLT